MSRSRRRRTIYSLSAGFSTRMHKRASSTQEETILDSEVPDGKCPKWSSLNDKVQRGLTVVTLDSLEQASNALPSLEGSS